MTVRLTKQEHAEFAALAAKEGLTIPSYIRTVGLRNRQTKNRARRTVDADAAMKLVAAMNKAGNLMNQAVMYGHVGKPLEHEYREALARVNEAVALVVAAYGKGEE